LCRCRHNLDHADTFVMPTPSEKALPEAVDSPEMSA
jgi:hypothetical protein